MATVFAVQNSLKMGGSYEKLVPKYDLSAAEEYGNIVTLLGPAASPFSPEAVLPELHEKLKNFGDDDYLLLVGNPALIGFACAIASNLNLGRVKLLQWSGKDRKYIPIEADLF